MQGVFIMAKSNKQDIVKVDSKGRVTIPRRIRKALGIEEGKAFFLRVNDDNSLQLKGAVEEQNSFDILANEAEKEYQEGKTRDFRSYIKEREQRKNFEKCKGSHYETRGIG